MKQGWRDHLDGLGALSIPVVLAWVVAAYLGGPLVGVGAVVLVVGVIAAWLYWPRPEP